MSRRLSGPSGHYDSVENIMTFGAAGHRKEAADDSPYSAAPLGHIDVDDGRSFPVSVVA